MTLQDLQVRVYAPKTRQTGWRLVPFSEETAAILANYFGIAASKLAAVRPKRSVLEDIVVLPQKRGRGRPPKHARMEAGG